jgi:hypothetical protein
MTKLYSLMLALIVSVVAYGQTTLYYEDFEPPSNDDLMTSTGNPGWAINTTYAFTGAQSYHSVVAVNDTSHATTIQFSTTGNSFVILSFAQIAKVSFFDGGFLEISTDNVNWIRVTDTNATYLGSGTFTSGAGYKFTAAFHPDGIWQPGVNTAVPNNSWWREEVFDISALAGNEPAVWIRFSLFDGNNDGSAGNYGWLLDDVKVVGYICDPALTAGTAAASRDSICNLDPVTLTLANSYGDIQWLSSTDGGLTWQLETGPGSNTDSLTVNPVQPIQYAAITSLGSCISDTSNILSIHVEQVVAPTTTGASRCGIGNITLSASGNGTLNWYDAQTGGNLLDTGAFFNTYITGTTTYYVSSVVGGSVTPASVTIGTGNVQNTPTSYPAPYGNWFWGARHQFLILASEMAALGINNSIDITSLAFDVVTPGVQALQNFEIKIGHTSTTSLGTWQTGLTSVYLASSYSETAGWNIHNFNSPFTWNGTDNIVVETCFNNSSYVNNAVVKQTATIFNSTLYAIQDATGVCTNPSLLTNTAQQRPNMLLSLTGGGCESPRTPVTATMTTAAAVSISASSVSLCEGDPTNLTVSSSNPGYAYTWSPNVNLSSTTGASVIATPLSPITYYVIGDDGICASIDSVFIDVGPAAIAGTATAPGDTVCTGNSMTLSLSGQQGNIQWWSSTDGVNWQMESGAGSNSAYYDVTPMTNTYYLAILSSAGCPEDTTNTLFITSFFPQAPVVTDATRCGYGPVTLQATGDGVLNWYPDPTSNSTINTGNTYSPVLSSTTTYYVASTVGSIPILFLETFENNGNNLPAGWTATGLWHVTDACVTGAPPNPSRWVYYGVDGACNFDFPAGQAHSGNLTSPVINIPSAATDAELRFRFAYSGENGAPPGGYDNASVQLSQNGGPFNMIHAITGGSFAQNQWNLASVDLSNYAGNNIQLRWNFNTVDGIANTGLGLQIDSVIIAGEGGCEGPRVPVTATITPPPAMTLTTTADSLCQGDTAILNISSSNAGYTYSWSPATGLDVTSGTTVNASPSTTMEYFVVADDGICGNIDSIEITVHPMTVAGIASGPDTVCSGLNAFLNLTGYTGNIQWQSFDGSTWVNETGPGSDSSMYQVSPSQTTTYQAVVQNGICPALTSNPITVIIIIPGNPVTTGDSRCGPGLVNLSASGNGIFYWYAAPQGGTHVNVGTSYSPNLDQTTTFYVQTIIGGDFYNIGPINNGFGNQTSAANSNYGMTFNVTQQATLEKVHVYPWSTGPITINLLLGGSVLASVTDTVIAFTGKTEIELGFSISPGTGYRLELITNGVSLGRNSTGASYPYSVPGGPLSITGYFNPGPGSGNNDYRYFYDWLVSTGCKSSRIPVTGEIIGLPSVPVVTQVGNLLVSSSPANNQWYYQGNLIPGATSSTYAPDSSGIYHVVVDNGSCQQTSNSIFFVHVGINDPEQISLNIYPNPNTGIFTIEFFSQEIKDAEIAIYNVTGEVVHTEKLSKLSGKYSGQADISSEADGLYFLMIKSGETRYFRKLIMAK